MEERPPKHIAFPRTPHLQGSTVVDDDAVVTAAMTNGMLRDYPTVLIQEKVDGTNVSVHFEQAWVPVCQKRSGLILQGEHEQYVRFRDFVYEHLEELNRVLGTRYALFGEWLLCRHGVEYDSLKSYFLAFDLWDKKDESFCSWNRMQEILDGVVDCVPILANKWNGSPKELEALIGTSKFSTKETAEGCQRVLPCASCSVPF